MWDALPIGLILQCNQHLLSIEVNEVWYELIRKIHSLMVELRSLKNRPKLAAVTLLDPIIRQDTRWNSVFNMIERYVNLCEETDHFRLCIGLNAATRNLVPTYEGAHNEHNEIKMLHEVLKKFEATFKTLQLEDSNKMSFDRVRFYFDKLISEHPEISAYLAEDGANVHNKDFEKAICKIQAAVRSQDLTVNLDRNQKSAVQIFLNSTTNAVSEDDNEVERSFIDLADEEFEQQSRKRPRTMFPYRCTDHVATTSVIVERLFSRCGIIMRSHRRSMDPSTLEMLVMLRFNKDLWDELEVEKAMKRSSNLLQEFATPISGGGGVSCSSSSTSSSRS